MRESPSAAVIPARQFSLCIINQPRALSPAGPQDGVWWSWFYKQWRRMRHWATKMVLGVEALPSRAALQRSHSICSRSLSFLPPALPVSHHPENSDSFLPLYICFALFPFQFRGSFRKVTLTFYVFLQSDINYWSYYTLCLVLLRPVIRVTNQEFPVSASMS